MTNQEALALINEKLSQIDTLFAECEAIADEHQIDFSISGPTYGMGGNYRPTPKPREQQADDDFDESSSWSESDYGWQASSQSC